MKIGSATSMNRYITSGLSYFALISTILILVWATIPFGSIERNNPIVLCTFIINGLMWAALLLYELKNAPFSFSVIHWCFFLLFFFFAAIVQYMNNSFPWVQYRSDDILIETNLVLFLWTIGILIGSFTKISKRKFNGEITGYLNRPIKNKSNVLLVLISVAIMLWRIKTIGIINLLSRGTSGYSVSENSAISLLVEHSMQALTYFSAVIAIISYKKRKCSIRVLIVCCGALVVSYPPTGISRYAAAAIYLGILLTFFDVLKRKNIFIFIFLGAYTFAMPLLNAFRNAAFGQVNVSNVMGRIVSDFSTMWLAGDYDAYTMLTLTIDSVSKHGITWMRQLLGAAFFWVPRALWKNKPVGSGHYVAEQLGWSFKNLSCPLPGEAYINLGIVGVVLFSVLIGKIMKRLDKCYWSNQDKGTRIIDALYPVMMLFFFFMCRGDLLSSTAYMIAYIVIGNILLNFNNKNIPTE